MVFHSKGGERHHPAAALLVVDLAWDMAFKSISHKTICKNAIERLSRTQPNVLVQTKLLASIDKALGLGGELVIAKETRMQDTKDLRVGKRR